MESGEQAERSRCRRSRRRRCLAYLAALAAFAGLFHRFLFLGNFAVVEPGRVYRSAQPRWGVERTLRDRRIATVLNLRGGSSDDSWYAAEVAATRRLGIDFYDLPLSAERRPTRAELLKIVELLPRCRYPLLIHCKSGSDRTGLAVALYHLVIEHEPPERAARAFSIWRGHVPAFGPQRLHQPLDEYAAWLAARGEAHTPDRFRAWLEGTYRDDGPARPVRPLKPGPRAEVAAAAAAPAPR